jgi:hypothetical protein
MIRRLVTLLSGALVLVIPIPATALLFDLTGRGPSADAATTATRFLHHIGHREYDEACAMSVNPQHPRYPLHPGGHDYGLCLATLIWLGDGDNWSPTDLRHAQRATVHRTHNGTVTPGDVSPHLPDMRGTTGSSVFLALHHVDGCWYAVWPPG